jgi:hypothetical protein
VSDHFREIYSTQKTEGNIRQLYGLLQNREPVTIVIARATKQPVAILYRWVLTGWSPFVDLVQEDVENLDDDELITNLSLFAAQLLGQGVLP